MNPIPIQRKINEILRTLDLQDTDFESVVYYNDLKEGVWTDKSCHNEEKRAFCTAILKSALELPDPILNHEFETVRTCSIHWTEGIIVLSGEFDSENILKTVVNDLRITV